MTYHMLQTPPAPAFQLNWPSIEAFPWIRAMAGVQQEPEWHAEGDVLVHTRLVAEAMTDCADWRARPDPDRHALFASALLHDVAKPACTRLEEGRWTSPRHAKVGEGMSRQLLWDGAAGSVPTFAEREGITRLVRYHGLPLRFLDKPDPSRAIVLASLEVNLRDVALLAMADVVGRITPGRPVLLDTIKLFVESAQELGCLDRPYPFEHAHHRFMYCVGGKPIEYVPHVPPDQFEVVLMSGLPGSGKSTLCRAIRGDRPVVCLDQIRQEMGVDGGEGQGAVIAAGREQALSYLRQRRSFIWDATNVSRDLRSGLVARFANYGATVRIIYVEAKSRSELMARNRGRKDAVPQVVMNRLTERLEIPSPAEAHHVEYRVV